MLSNPEFRNMLEDAAAKPWYAWVEAWIGLELKPGEVLEGEAELDALGTPIVSTVRYSHLGPDYTRPGHILLRFEMRIDDPRFMAGLGDFATRLTGETDPATIEAMREMSEDLPAELDFHHEKIIDASLDPKGVVPARVEYVERSTVRGRKPGILDEDLERLETHEWTFEWLEP